MASPDRLWPPDHDLHEIEILGVTDPEEESVTIQVTSIMQDEGVHEKGSGKTCPDAVIEGDGAR